MVEDLGAVDFIALVGGERMTNEEMLIDIGIKLATIGGTVVTTYHNAAYQVKLGKYSIHHEQTMQYGYILHAPDDPELHGTCEHDSWRHIGIYKGSRLLLWYRYYNGSRGKDLITFADTDDVVEWPTHEELPLDEVYMLVTAKYNGIVRANTRDQLEIARIAAINAATAEEYMGRQNNGIL